MPVELISKLSGSLPIDVRNVRADETPTKIAETLIHIGNQCVAVAEAFDIKGDNRNDQTLVWQGELSHVHHIGHGNSSAKVIVEGTAGDHVGTQMSGGEILVRGSVRDFAGTEMKRGTIRIENNGGDYVGGAFAGSKSGMNRGSILIAGDVGKYAGIAMRRGSIVIGGKSGPGLGTDMLAGTIIAFGEANGTPGVNMKRGTIIAAAKKSSFEVPKVNFGESGRVRPAVIAMIAKWLKDVGLEFDVDRLINREFDQFAGDLVNGGRGELFVGV